MRRRVVLSVLLLPAVLLGLGLWTSGTRTPPAHEKSPSSTDAPTEPRPERTRATVTQAPPEPMADDPEPFVAVDPETGLCNVRVEVVDQDGRPVPDARVAAWQAGRRSAHARADDDGRLVLRGLDPRPTEIRVGPDVVQPDHEVYLSRVRLPCGFVYRLVLPIEATVHGRVVNLEGEPVPDAYVGVGGMRSLFYRFVRADEDGWYELPMGAHGLTVRDAFFAWAPGYAVAHVLPSRPVEPGPAVRMDALLRPQRPLDREDIEQAQQEIADVQGASDADEGAAEDLRRASGRLVNPSGDPIAGASITDSWTCLGRSDEEGRFDVEHDAYSLWFEAVGFTEKQWEIEGEEAGDVVLTPRRDLRVQVVFDDDGSPVVGARVYCGGEEAITDAAGLAIVRGLDEEVTQLFGSVQPLGHEHPAPVYTRFEHDSSEPLPPIRVPRGGSIAGRVVDAGGTPVFPLMLWVEDQPEDVWLRTDSEGRFKVVGLPTDRAVTLSAIQWERVGFEVEFDDLLPGRDVDLTLRLPATRTISGLVRAPDDVDAGTLELVALPIGERPDGVRGRPREVPLEADGSFAFECVDGLSYRLSLAENRAVARTLGPENTFPAGASGITVEARRGATIRGSIVASGLRTLSMRVEFHGTEGGSYTTYSEVDGRFDHTGLEPGHSYVLRVDRKTTGERLEFGPFEAGDTDVILRLDERQDDD